MAVKILETQKAMKIGVDNVVACRISDTETNYEAISEVIALPGAMALNVNANFNLEVAFYDNGPGDVASTLGVIEVTFNKAALGSKEKAWLLGLNEVEETEEIVYSQNNVSPYIALGFRSLRSDGSYSYSWLLKGKFTLPEDNNETKADSINFQSEELTGRFVTTEFAFPTKGEGAAKTTNKKLWKVEMNEAFTTEITDSVKKASAQLMTNGWEYLVNNLEKATEGKKFVQAKSVKIKKPDGTDITTSGLTIPFSTRDKVFQIKGEASPENTSAGDVCIQGFNYWECSGANDYTPATPPSSVISTAVTAGLTDYGNGKFKFQEQSQGTTVKCYIACQAIYGTNDAKKIITVTAESSSNTRTKTVDYQDKK